MAEEINKDEKIPTPEELGIPSGSFDPMQTIRMEGDMYRGLLNSGHHSLFLRTVAIIFSVLFFLLPALLIFYFIFFIPQGESVNTGSLMMTKAVLDPIFFLGNVSGLFSLKTFAFIYAVISFFVGASVIARNAEEDPKNNENNR